MALHPALGMASLRNCFGDLLRDGLSHVQVLARSWSGESRKFKADRAIAVSTLNAFSRQYQSHVSPQFRNILIDGMWDNPNYWVRYSLVRRALGLAAGKEKGLLGRHSRTQVRKCFFAFGITDLVDYAAAAKITKRHMEAASALLVDIKTPDDFLRLRLPCDFPSALVYDGILKRQRRAAVEINDPALPKFLAEALAHIEAANHMVEVGAFDLVVLSHALDYTYAALAWAALKRNIPVLVLYGDYGTARFFRLKEPADLFAYPGRPTQPEISCLSPGVQEHLHEQGALQLRARLLGKTDDVGAVYAYQRRQASVNRALLAERFGWDPAKPVIGVYNSNWFDYPHGSGLHYFRDFLEWIEQTLAVANTHDSVNWLFKAHPCDDWYASIRGTRLEDLVTSASQPHIRLADKAWNGLDLIQTLDGIVTCHGTIGIEATALGTPVLVAHPGWYGHAGFVVNPATRDNYLAVLRTEWWKTSDRESARQRAELFAGWMFCVPNWHGNYVMQDDTRQSAIYSGLSYFLNNNANAMEREVQEIRDWVEAGHCYFHVFKMMRASSFQTSLAMEPPTI